MLRSCCGRQAGPDHQNGGSWQDEKAILEWYGAVRAYIEKNDGIDTIKQDVTLDLVEKAIEGVKSQQPVRGAAPHPHTQHTEAVVPACTRAWGWCTRAWG